MPAHPRSKRACRTCGGGTTCSPLAERAGELVPVGRGGERRAIALANPSLGGRPFATPTLWAAIQYLMPGEDAPEHRHTQHAFRFVVEGEGVWTVVGGDPVPMRRGDFLPQAGWNWHAHHNASERADGLDRRAGHPVPVRHRGAVLRVRPRARSPTRERITPDRSRSERLWGHPGPASGRSAQRTAPGTPLLAYRWEYTDRALADQLALEDEGYAGTVEPGHAAVRFTNPATGGDVLPTIRAEFHRVRSGAETAPCARPARRSTRSSTAPARSPSATEPWTVTRGDLFVVPSWQPFSARSEARRRRLRLRRPGPVPLLRRPDLRGAPPRPHTRGRNPPMKLATIRTARRHPRPCRLEGDRLVDLGADRPRRAPGRPTGATAAEAARRRRTRSTGADFAPVVPQPVQGGLRRAQLPQPHPGDGPRPARVPDALRQVRRHPDRRQRRHRPARRDRALDWEVELAVVIGSAGPPGRDRGRRGGASPASPCSTTSPCRDWQFRTREWLQGKIWEATTPVGPYLVTPDELPGGVRPALDVRADRRRRA